ncbi:MAG TPA: hypothetical protein VFG58_04855 [Solirubrobacterales bacterium]|nr:hypothetical protein [Solirubrobacterales bacterium]
MAIAMGLRYETPGRGNRDEPVAEFFDPARHARVAATYGVVMAPIDADSVRTLLEAIIAGFAVLGGAMAYFSGFEAFIALRRSQSQTIVTERINRGLGVGFAVGAPFALMALMIMSWTR